MSSPDAAPTGDALCAAHSKGMLCNECSAGHYRVASGPEAGKCRSCREVDLESMAIASFVVFLVCAVLGSACFKAAFANRRARAVLQRAADWLHKTPAEEKHWWLDVLTTLWLMGQTITLFLRVEAVSVPLPFSWILVALDFLTLQPLASFFFSPCAFVSYRSTVVFTTLFPFLLAPIVTCLAFLYFLLRTATRLSGGWRAAMDDLKTTKAEVFGAAMRVYVVLLLMTHTTVPSPAFFIERGRRIVGGGSRVRALERLLWPQVCVTIFDHFHCKGPYQVGADFSRRRRRGHSLDRKTDDSRRRRDVDASRGAARQVPHGPRPREAGPRPGLLDFVRLAVVRGPQRLRGPDVLYLRRGSPGGRAACPLDR